MIDRKKPYNKEPWDNLKRIQNITPSVTPVAEPPSTFHPIRQGSATNLLTKTRARVGVNTELDPITDVATITRGGLTLFFSDFSNMVSGLKQSTYKLLDALTLTFTEGGAKSTTVQLPLQRYMDHCGLKDRKEARKQVVLDLEVLFNLRLSYKGRSKREQDFADIRLCDAKAISNGVITFNFSQPFYSMLMGFSVMPYPEQLLRLNAKYNPNSYYLGRKIAEHKRMNAGKSNEDIIAVATLLQVCPDLPSYEEIMATSKHVDQRIIQPFERDMNALSEMLAWEYCHRNGATLTDEELLTFEYKTFSSCLIRITWNGYPNQRQQIESKPVRAHAKHIYQSKKALTRTTRPLRTPS